MFEAIKIDSHNTSNDKIIIDFLDERFQFKMRIPYKYIMKINNKSMTNSLHNIRQKYTTNEHGELSLSDQCIKFFANDKVSEFYQQKSDELSMKNGISSECAIENSGTNFMTKYLYKNKLY